MVWTTYSQVLWNGSMAVQLNEYNWEPTNARWNHCPLSFSHSAMKVKNGNSVGCLPTRSVQLQSDGYWRKSIQMQMKKNDFSLEQLNWKIKLQKTPHWITFHFGPFFVLQVFNLNHKSIWHCKRKSVLNIQWIPTEARRTELVDSQSRSVDRIDGFPQ